MKKGICEYACSLISKKNLLVSSFNYQSLRLIQISLCKSNEKEKH